MYLRTQQSSTKSLTNNGRNAVEAVVINNSSSAVGRIKEQLGKVHPLMHSRRIQAHKSHIADDWRPKGLDISPLVEPLSRRHQAHLSYNFSSHLQDQLGAGKLSSGNDGRKRSSFRDIDPISISPTMPLINEVTGRRLANATPRLL